MTLPRAARLFIARCVLAAAFVVLALLVRLELLRPLGAASPYLTFYPAVMLAALAGGLFPGALATVLSTLAVDYFITPPLGGLELAQPADTLTLSVFIMSSMMISCVCEAMLRARRRAEKAEQAARIADKLKLLQTEERLRILGDNLPESAVYQYMLVPPEGARKFVYFSAGLERLTGLKPEEVLRDAQVLYARVLPEYAEALRAAEAKSERDFSDLDMEIPLRRTDGEVRWMRLHSRPRRLPDGQLLWDGVQVDITERKRVEEKLKAADRRKDDFLAMLAHELRNPLAAISAAAGLLSRPGTDEPTMQMAKEALRRRIHQFSRLVDDLLDVSRISRGKLELRKQAVDLRSVISEATASAQSVFQEREQTLTVQVTGPLPVFGDPVRLEQIVSNLLTNASRYSEPGQEIALSAVREADTVVVRVRDYGIGISKDFLGQLFEPLSQAAQPLARSRGGLGLGLAIVKQLCELHHGTVSAQSAGEGEGSEFEVRLPASEAARQTDAPLGVPPAIEKLQILVVEDSPDTAMMQAAMLEHEGHRVEVAGDGPTAIQMALHTKPDVILLDIGLPEMDGYEVARRLRGAGLQQATIIAVTGYGQERDIVRSQDAGIDYHLLKPVDYEKLGRLISQRHNEHAPERRMSREERPFTA